MLARIALVGFALLGGACSSDDSGNPVGGGGESAGGSASASGSASPGGSASTGGSGAAGKPSTGKPTVVGDVIGDAHSGVYHLGPVDFAETEWHNACAPTTKYKPELQSTVGLNGEYLAAVANAFNDGGGVCDACIFIETAKGKSIVARVVTYGVQQADGDIDVSPSVFEAIHQNEDPRLMTWHFSRCPDVGGLKYEFKSGSNPFWTSLWVRNPRVPLVKAEVKASGDAEFVTLERASDGALTDPTGFGDGPFTLRLTAMDGQVVTDELAGFVAEQVVESTKQFE